MEKASALFAAKFEEKTGNEWEVDDHNDRYVVNKGTADAARDVSGCSYFFCPFFCCFSYIFSVVAARATPVTVTWCAP